MKPITVNVTRRSGAPAQSLGRNGAIQTTGIRIVPGLSGPVLSPVTTRGEVARCEVALPDTPHGLRELAAVLLMAAEDLEPSCEAA